VATANPDNLFAPGGAVCFADALGWWLLMELDLMGDVDWFEDTDDAARRLAPGCRSPGAPRSDRRVQRLGLSAA
jgi:hypothetical protein